MNYNTFHRTTNKHIVNMFLLWKVLKTFYRCLFNKIINNSIKIKIKNFLCHSINKHIYIYFSPRLVGILYIFFLYGIKCTKSQTIYLLLGSAIKSCIELWNLFKFTGQLNSISKWNLWIFNVFTINYFFFFLDHSKQSFSFLFGK